MFEKNTLWRKACAVPLLIRVPRGASDSLPAGTPRGGATRARAPVSLVDVAPTLLDLAGLLVAPHDARLAGASLVGALGARGEAGYPHDAVMTNHKVRDALPLGSTATATTAITIILIIIRIIPVRLIPRGLLALTVS